MPGGLARRDISPLRERSTLNLVLGICWLATFLGFLFMCMRQLLPVIWDRQSHILARVATGVVFAFFVIGCTGGIMGTISELYRRAGSNRKIVTSGSGDEQYDANQN
jgi:hypothetical protein